MEMATARIVQLAATLWFCMGHQSTRRIDALLTCLWASAPLLDADHGSERACWRRHRWWRRYVASSRIHRPFLKSHLVMCLFTWLMLERFCSRISFFWLSFLLAGSLGNSGFVHFCLFCLILRISRFSPFSRISRSGCFWFCLNSRFDGQEIHNPKPSNQWPQHPSTPYQSIPPTQPHPTTSQPHPTILYYRPHTRPSGGHGWRSTRTDLNLAEDRQEHTRVPCGGGEERPHALEYHGGRGETQEVQTRHPAHPPHGMSANLIKLCSGPRNIPLREGDYIDWRHNLLDVSFELWSVNFQPWHFTNNSLGLPHAHSLSVCLCLWVCVVCVCCFLLYLSFYLCCARCVFWVLFYVHNHLFAYLFISLQI